VAAGRRRVQFAVSDAVKLTGELNDLGLSYVNQTPVVVARDVSERRYVMRQPLTYVSVAAICVRFHRRRLPQGNGCECPRKITHHRAPPYEEFGLGYNFRHEFARLFLGKSIETAASRAALFDSSMH